MSKVIIANWKANPSTLAEAQELFRAEVANASNYQNVKTVICPPFAYLEKLVKLLNPIPHTLNPVLLGAQDVFWKESEIPEPQKLGISHVLVGHSDRRYPPAGGGETDDVINEKIKAALEAGITPVLLVGERDRSDDRQAILEKQLLADLAGLDSSQASRVLIAYEPVWAISTTPGAEADTPENTLEALGIIKDFLTKRYTLNAIRFLYGGSVTEKNVADFLSHPEVSGAVIGGASLRKDEFANILKIVSEIE